MSQVVDNLDINSEVNGFHILALLAEELKSVAERENNIFSPVLSQWFPEALVFCLSLLHQFYREKLVLSCNSNWLASNCLSLFL